MDIIERGNTLRKNAAHAKESTFSPNYIGYQISFLDI